MVPVAPILKASTKARALRKSRTWCMRFSQLVLLDWISPRESRTAIPTHPANTLGFSKMEVMRTPASTPERAL